MSESRHPNRPPAPKNSSMSVDQLEQASDATLVVSIGRYHEDALAEVYRRHAGAVFALSRRLLSDRTLAEEVVQEVFLRLWNDPDRFDPDNTDEDYI